MTKPRQPETKEEALHQTIARLTVPYVMEITGKSRALVYRWTDPDYPESITSDDLETINDAYIDTFAEKSPYDVFRDERTERKLQGLPEAEKEVDPVYCTAQITQQLGNFALSLQEAKKNHKGIIPQKEISRLSGAVKNIKGLVKSLEFSVFHQVGSA